MRIAFATLAALTLALAACSKHKAEDETAAAAPPPPPQKTVFDTQLKSLQKAKDVQKTVDQQKADLEQAVKDQGGG
jgi:hypothetical protein